MVRVGGRVQGVGFRWWVLSQARELGLAGSVRNLPDGRVEIRAQGSPVALAALVERTTEQPSTTARPGMVSSHQISWHPADPSLHGFDYR